MWRAIKIKPQSGDLILTAGTLINIAGAFLNSLGIKEAFLVWVLSNSLCFAFFLGAVEGRWGVDKADDKKMVIMYAVFIGTAIIGWTR